MGAYFPPLNLDADADERAVKRAYAAALKSKRPDDDPEAFQDLVRTRDAALEWVKRRPALATLQTMFGTDATWPPLTADETAAPHPDAAPDAGPRAGVGPESATGGKTEAGAGSVAELEARLERMMPELEAVEATPVPGSDQAAGGTIVAEPGPAVVPIDDLAGPAMGGAEPTEADPAGAAGSGAVPDLVSTIDGAPSEPPAPPPTPSQPDVLGKPTPTPQSAVLPPPVSWPPPAAPLPLVRTPPPPPVDRFEALSPQEQMVILVATASALIAGHDVTRLASWQRLLEAASDLDIAGRMAFERVVARDLDEAMQSRGDLDPALGDRLSAVLIELDKAFGWSNDMRHLVRILGEPSGAHPLVFAVERFGVRAPRLAWTEAGFPVIPPADLAAWYQTPDHPAIRDYQAARQRGGFGFSWSWFAFLSPPAWAVMDGRPLLGVAMMGAALAATLVLFDPVVDVGTANAYVSFMVAVVMSRIALAVAARPLGISRLVGVIAKVDARAPASSAERRKMIAAGRTGSRFGAVLAAFLFLVSDGYALELALRSLFLAPELVAAVVGPADRKDLTVSFAERLVTESYLETSADLVDSIDKLVRDGTGSDAAGARHMAKLLALQQEVHRAVDRLPIGDFPREFADLRRRINKLKPK